MKLYQHVPHPHIEHRKKTGPVTTRTQRNLEHPNPVIRFNSRFALICTIAVGSMWCAYAFAALAFSALPTALKPGNIGFSFWLSSDFFQLTLLSIIIVGQNILARASDKRAEQTYLDAEATLHEQQQAAAHLAAQDEKILAILEQIAANTALTEEVKTVVAGLGEHPEMQQAVQMQSAIVLDETQVKQMVAAVQKNLLEQARSSRKPPPEATGA